MPAPFNITNLPGARQPVTNNDGTMDRVWYRFFFNLFNLTGAGSSDTSITDLLITPSLETVDDIAGQEALQEVGSLPPVTDLGAVYAALQSLNEQPQPPDLGPVLVALDGLSMAPSNQGGSLTSITAGTGITTSPSPITSSGVITMADTGVTPGKYTAANITIDQQGRITAAANGVAGTVTSVASGAGLTGGPITGSGALSLDLASANTFTKIQTAPAIVTTATTVAGLPATTAGSRAFVTDSTLATGAALGLVVVGGGANAVPVYADGAAWRVG